MSRMRIVRCGLMMLAAGPLAATARGAATSYSTSGTVGIANEPDHRLIGISDASFADQQRLYNPSGATGMTFSLGAIPIVPIQSFGGGGPLPAEAGAPFDVLLAPSGPGLPTLEIRGTLQWAWDTTFSGNRARVDSVTSSAPWLDVNLPAPLAHILAHPGDLGVYAGVWDWDTKSIGLVANAPATPEPSTWLAFAAGFGALGLARRRQISRGGR